MDRSDGKKFYYYEGVYFQSKYLKKSVYHFIFGTQHLPHFLSKLNKRQIQLKGVISEDMT